MQQFIDMCDYPFDRLAASNEIVAIDTETIGNTRATNIPFYFSWASDDLGSGAGPLFTQTGVDFLTALCQTDRPKLFWNAKFDVCRVLEPYGFPVKGPIHDAILMHVLLDEHHLECHRLKEC